MGAREAVDPNGDGDGMTAAAGAATLAATQAELDTTKAALVTAQAEIATATAAASAAAAAHTNLAVAAEPAAGDNAGDDDALRERVAAAEKRAADAEAAAAAAEARAAAAAAAAVPEGGDDALDEVTAHVYEDAALAWGNPRWTEAQVTRTLEILYRRNSTKLQNGMFYHHVLVADRKVFIDPTGWWYGPARI